MFDENFSFTQRRSPSLDSNHAHAAAASSTTTTEPSRSVSPCSPTSPYPLQYTVTDLAATFATSRLRPDAQICYDSCESYANTDDDAGWEIPPPDDLHLSSARRISYALSAHPYSSSDRVRRQCNTRLLCSASHTRDIAALVSDMVRRNDQCTVVAPESVSPTIEVDEGYTSGEGNGTASSRRSSTVQTRTHVDFRRSSELKRSRTSCVMKSVRLRKKKDHGRTSSYESAS